MKRLLLVLCLASASAALAQTKGPIAAIHGDIDKLSALYNDGFGRIDKEARHIAFGPVFKPDRHGAVAFFILSGVDLMNGHEEYIAVFAQGEGRSPPVAKERPYRLVA